MISLENDKNEITTGPLQPMISHPNPRRRAYRRDDRRLPLYDRDGHYVGDG